MKCDHCNREAITYLRYSGAHLCSEHFINHVQRVVKREVRREISVTRGDTIGVAVSGGKDSMVTLSILNDIFNSRNGIDLVCISIDEGIAGYRPPSLDIVKKFCDEKGIEYRCRSFSELSGLSMDDIAPVCGNMAPCTYCGVFRRKLMNDEARKVGAKYLATGHNLDDLAQSILMDFSRGDAARLARLGPHNTVRPGLIPRFYPLRMLPEMESLLYAMVAEVPFWDGECPYWEAALRNEYRTVVDGLEDRTPGTKYGILSSYDTVRPLLQASSPSQVPNFCACGEPCNGKRCKACEYEEDLARRLSGIGGP